ncbi:MAG: RNA polymerase sigma factor [Desulfobulbaceae bacterium]|nr:RNA polymerase sigma factor [Desulfobulbaceae bacterium]
MIDSQTHANILKRALAGDVQAFEKLVSHHYDMVYRCGYRLCGHREDGEDVAQEVFIKVADKLHLFNNKSSFSTWLYRIAVNTARDYLRKKSRAAEVPYENGVHGAQDITDNPGRYDALLKAVDKLSPKLRETVVLVYGEELGHKEAAEILGCAETTISWRIFKAKRKLRDLLS